MDNMKIIAVRMRRIRTIREMTREELRNKTGISTETIRKYEEAEIANINKVQLCKIASALGISVQYLLDIELPAYYIEDSEDAVRRILGNQIHMCLDKYEKLDDATKRMVQENIDVLLKYA